MNIRMKISKGRKERTVSVSFDADRFERVAGNFGMFNKHFIQSLDRAERDINAGRITIIDSLKELRD
jgi:hypothetical protein